MTAQQCTAPKWLPKISVSIFCQVDTLHHITPIYLPPIHRINWTDSITLQPGPCLHSTNLHGTHLRSILLISVNFPALWQACSQLIISQQNQYNSYFVFFVGVLCPTNISGHIRMCSNMLQCTLMATSLCCPTGTAGHRSHDLIPHSHITLILN